MPFGAKNACRWAPTIRRLLLVPQQPGLRRRADVALIKSCMRTLQLFELFELVQCPMSLGEIVAHTEFPQSSVAALLATLIAMGYVSHDRFLHTYSPTSALANLGAWIPPPSSVDPVLRCSGAPVLRQSIHELPEKTGELVIVGEIWRGAARYTEVVPPKRRPVTSNARAGVVRSLTDSAIGIALLSRLDPVEIKSG